MADLTRDWHSTSSSTSTGSVMVAGWKHELM
jgi:hypothetical protein